LKGAPADLSPERRPAASPGRSYKTKGAAVECLDCSCELQNGKNVDWLEKVNDEQYRR
jgi:hypothetical protein